jgi:hypothetical protein
MERAQYLPDATSLEQMHAFQRLSAAIALAEDPRQELARLRGEIRARFWSHVACAECGKEFEERSEFAARSSLSKHALEHTLALPDGRLACPQCERDFSNGDAFQQHWQAKHAH